MKKYPFSEGDDYYTIDNGKVVWSCWDDVSEELHTPDKKYFASEQEAKMYIDGEKKIHCKSCGSTNVRMTDYSPLALDEDLLTIGQFDNELYGQFDCFDCETSFQEVLEISIR
jgi:hypothetical protein